jgi:hypothetical protein
MTVLEQDELAPVVAGVLFGEPLPIIVIPMPPGTVIPPVHVQVPAGMFMVSPSTAVCVGPLMTAFTSDRLQDEALYVPCALPEGARKSNTARKKTANKESNLVIFVTVPRGFECGFDNHNVR